MLIRRMCCLAGLIMMMWINPANAACTGSGTAWTCPAGATTSDVQNAINSASNGATITFAAGSYSWSSPANFSTSKGTTLICATQGSCVVSASGTVLGMSTWTGTITNLYRISGFTFNQSNSGLLIWFGSGGGMSGTLTQVRIDHNTFNLSTEGVAITLGENSSVNNVYGVIDHNAVNSAGSSEMLYMLGALNSTPPSSPLGTANNIFVEDNTMTVTTMTDAGLGCMDGWGGDAIVWRHNTVTNCLVTSHGVTHAGGPASIELYNNSFIMNSGASGFTDCYRCFHHQGSGEFIAFNNAFTASGGKNPEVISMLHYRDYSGSIDGGMPYCNGTQSVDANRSPSATNYGYPCWRQPGRDFAGNLKPMYVWNNYWSDTRAQISMVAPDGGYGSPDYYTSHMQANRDWYNSVSASAQTSSASPFNGTTGMGFGTLANRPATCTTNANENGGGVGYFATDQGSQGTLYRCSATNTWTAQYTPYTYPHPLVAGTTATVQPPTNIQATAH